MALRQPNVLPGFGLTFGFTTFFLSALVLLPLAALVIQTALFAQQTVSWEYLGFFFPPAALNFFTTVSSSPAVMSPSPSRAAASAIFSPPAAMQIGGSFSGRLNTRAFSTMKWRPR